MTENLSTRAEVEVMQNTFFNYWHNFSTPADYSGIIVIQQHLDSHFSESSTINLCNGLLRSFLGCNLLLLDQKYAVSDKNLVPEWCTIPVFKQQPKTDEDYNINAFELCT